MGSSESGMDQSEENEDKKAEEDLKNEIYVLFYRLRISMPRENFMRICLD